ncbi:EamA family transporter RarD [Arthrobacter sp. zg-Y1116]|uniref:EamA family transporter RarD n=1 Tax=Arthrobacter sp. zg-Y1116 TaxID=2964611 RepID=UPI002102F733|nr:EamA family transporter RarD [Arthrobacter sp. zg-Y1116]
MPFSKPVPARRGVRTAMPGEGAGASSRLSGGPSAGATAGSSGAPGAPDQSAAPSSSGPSSSGHAGTGRENLPGILFGIGAYGLWGLLPLYFMVLKPAGAVEIVANRVVWSLVFCAILLTVMRAWKPMLAAGRNPRTVGTLAGAALLIAVNWLTYSWAVLNEHAVEAALGYFINPIVSVLLGVLVLKEKLRPLQWAAMAVGFIAVLVLAFAYGTVPWVALALAFSFGFYGLVKKGIGSRVDAVSSLTIETAVLTPIAVGVMIWLSVTGAATLTTNGAGHLWLLVASGIITAVPLIFFGAAARRLPLSTVGLLQYLAPTLQFILALTVFKEAMPPERWAGFGLVWLALVMLTVDMIGGPRRNRRLRAAAAV